MVSLQDLPELDIFWHNSCNWMKGSSHRYLV